jgi:hypothetical protein
MFYISFMNYIMQLNHASLFIFCSLYSWWFMCFGWWGYYLWDMVYNGYMKIICLNDLQKQGKLFPLVKFCCVHSLLMIKSSICTYLGGGLYLVMSFDSIYISEFNCLYAIGTRLWVISIPCVSCWLKSFNITSLCCHQLPKRGGLKHLGPYLCFGN